MLRVTVQWHIDTLDIAVLQHQVFAFDICSAFHLQRLSSTALSIGKAPSNTAAQLRNSGCATRSKKPTAECEERA